MSDRVYKKIRLVGTSKESYEKAIQNAVAEAQKTVRGLAWFEVMEFRGALTEGGGIEYQATIELGFRIERAAQV